MKVTEIKPEILAKIDKNVIKSAQIRGAGIRFWVRTCICVQQQETSGINGCKSFENYEDALAAVQKWMNGVCQKYQCSQFGRRRGYDDGMGFTNLIGYTSNGKVNGWQPLTTKKRRGLPIYATAVIACGVDR